MAYGDFRDLNRRTAADKVLRDKTFSIAENLKYDGYQRGLASMVYNFFNKKTTSFIDKSISGGRVKNEKISNKEIAEELHKPVIKKLKKRKTHSPFMDNIWGTDLTGMQSISKFNKRFRFLLRVVDIYSKYA